MSKSPSKNSITAESDATALVERSSDVTATILRWALVAVSAVVVASSLLLVSPSSAPSSLVEETEVGVGPSALSELVEFLSLGYAHATFSGREVKSLPIGLGVGVVALIVGVGLIRRVGRSESLGDNPSARTQADWSVQWLGQLRLVDIAQVLLVLTVLWSVISRSWSAAPDLSIRATAVVAIQAAWALALSRGLAWHGSSAGAVRAVAMGIVLSCFVATALVLRLHGLEQWPAESFFPVGSSRVYAACMVPAFILTLAWMPVPAANARRGSRAIGIERWTAHVVGLAGLLLVLIMLAWGIASSGSQASWLGCAAGVFALVWFWTSGRRKTVAVVGAALMPAALAWTVVSARSSGSVEAADVRLSGYGARGALQTWVWSRGTGVGQGGYTMSCESARVAEQVGDPTALTVRWDGHANCEWLEVLADLGLIGFHLTIGVYILTLLAGIRALKELDRGPLRRCLIGLMAALAAMAVQECLGSGLRTSPLPVMWYTILAAIWAILLSCRTARPAIRPNRSVGLVGTLLVVGVGIAVSVLAWRDFVGERGLVRAENLLRDGKLDEAIMTARRAAQGILNPRRQVRTQSTLARANLGLGMIQFTEVYQESRRALASARRQAQATSGPTSRPGGPSDTLRGLWSDTSFRMKWDESERRFDLSLRTLAEMEDRIPYLPARAALEGKVANALASLWRLRATLSAGPNGKPSGQVVDQIRRYERRRLRSSMEAIERDPFNQALIVSLLRSEGKLPLDQVIALVRCPLRNPTLSDEYRSLVLQVSTSDGFSEALQPLLNVAREDAAGGGMRKDPFSPETFWLSAIVWGAKNKPKTAIAALSQACRLYASNPYLSIQRARAMSDLAWYQLVAEPDKPGTALALLRKSLEISRRPDDHRSVRPIYRRMMYVLLALGDEGAARDLALEAAGISGGGNPDPVVGWSYEVLARAFHHLDPDKRPKQWEQWVERAAQLHPVSPGAGMLVAMMAGEKGNGDRAAECLRRVWNGKLSRQDRQECLRALRFVLQKNPTNLRLIALRARISHAIRATTQRAATGTATTRQVPTP